ncbi:MAG: DUF4918 family protein [Hymenobacteraceae bacterium]|nr:DUF4918 family protein [Hymenobacteraceae bacterium]
MSFADRLLSFLTTFPAPAGLPTHVMAANPYIAEPSRALLTTFAGKFYGDERSRVAVLGINPGRFGGGTTGISFTDPVALADFCGIPNALPRRREMSSEFVYQFIAALGGPAEFYAHFYLGSVYPMVLLKEGLNYNYYDAPALTRALWPQLLDSLRQQVEVGFRRDVVVSLGRRNAQFLRKLNQEVKLFDEIIELDHPRYIMQYKRRALAEYVAQYVAVLGGLVA